jgi:hypothetical protein
LFAPGNVENGQEGLPDACGCYIISVRNVVWYVGLAEKQAFRRECFAPHTITKIDEAITEGAGHAMLHLLAKSASINNIDNSARPCYL